MTSYVLRTRPVSSTLAPTAAPAIRDSKIDETSDAATRDVCRIVRKCAIQTREKEGGAKRATSEHLQSDVRGTAGTYQPSQSHRSEKQRE